MTNKEIKLELAKAALAACRHMTSESLSESIKNLYDWIMEDEEILVTNEEKKTNPDKPVTEIIHWINGQEKYRTVGFGVRLQQVLKGNSINTVDDLLGIGRTYFKRYRKVGSGMLHCVDDALEELYGIKTW